MKLPELPPVVPLLSLDEVASPGDAAYAELLATRGGIANVFKSLANSPACLPRVVELGTYLRAGSDLPPVVREAVILAVTREARAAYEWTHHWLIAEGLGVLDTIERVIADPEGADDPVLGVAVRWGLAVARRTIPTGLEVEALAQLGAAWLTDVTVLVGYYLLLAGVVEAFRIPLEPGVDAVPFDLGRPCP